MTDEMLELARRNAAEAGAANVQFLNGHMGRPTPGWQRRRRDLQLRHRPLGRQAAGPPEVARMLRCGERFAVSDVIADEDIDAATRADVAAWTGCIAGALTRAEYERYVTAAGLIGGEIDETHRVHEDAASAIVRARNPASRA